MSLNESTDIEASDSEERITPHFNNVINFALNQFQRGN